MRAPTRALIVEDIDSWVVIFERAARRAGASEIVTCGDLDEVREALRQGRFDIAILDIGLDPNDEANAEGTKALEMIRAADGEGTRCILVTGWQGGDRMDLQAQLSAQHGVEWAYMKEKYEAPAVIAKLSELLEDATERRLAAATPIANLGAGMEQFLFEAQLLKRLSPAGGIQTLYYAVQRLLTPVIPLVAQDPVAPMASAEGGSLLGCYWSRALATAVAVELDSSKDIREDDEVAAEVARRLSLRGQPELLIAVQNRNILGRLWELPSIDRNEFPA